MGDLNAVSFAQIAHANLLRKFGGLREEHSLVYRRPIPMSAVQEGVMIDDHVVTAIVPLTSRPEDAMQELEAAKAGGEASGDVDVIARSLRAYESIGIQPKVEKQVRFSFGPVDVWGGTYDGIVGSCRSKLAVHWRAFGVTSLGAEN